MQVINDFQPEYIVNFAAQSMVGESWNQPENWFMTNTVSTINFHDKLRHCSFIKKYIHISTPEVYGNCTGLVKENTNYNPSTPYAVSRAAADMSLMSFIKTYNFPVIFTRAANVYGAGQQLYRIIPRTIIYFLTGRKLSLHGGGHSERSFIHISDVCNGTLLACQKGNPGDIFHFSTSQIISIRSLVEKIATKMNIDFHKHVEIVGDRLGKDSAYLLDSSQAKIQLNWTNSVNIDAGIEETISWVTNNLDILKNENFNYVHKK
jgi:dTDP-glucose 4,6-dehydratase